MWGCRFMRPIDDPDLLMEAATWWIQTQRLDHFEKALKIKSLIEQMDYSASRHALMTIS